MPQNSNEPNPKTLILHIEWGGLGDNLFYSHLPKIAKTIGDSVDSTVDSTGGGN